MLSIVSIKHKRFTEILKLLGSKTNHSKHQLRENEDRQTQKTHCADSPTLCEGMQLVGNKQVLQSPTQFPYTRNVVLVKKST